MACRPISLALILDLVAFGLDLRTKKNDTHSCACVAGRLALAPRARPMLVLLKHPNPSLMHAYVSIWLSSCVAILSSHGCVRPLWWRQ